MELWGRGSRPFQRGISRGFPGELSQPGTHALVPKLERRCPPWFPPPGPQSPQSHRSRASGLGRWAGEGPNGNCCHLLSMPPFPHSPAWASHNFLLLLVGRPIFLLPAAPRRTPPHPTRRSPACSRSLRLCLAESDLERRWGRRCGCPPPHQLALRCDSCDLEATDRHVSVGSIGVEKPRLRLERQEEAQLGPWDQEAGIQESGAPRTGFLGVF